MPGYPNTFSITAPGWVICFLQQTQEPIKIIALALQWLHADLQALGEGAISFSIFLGRQTIHRAKTT
jgi:hypothetical protein